MVLDGFHQCRCRDGFELDPESLSCLRVIYKETSSVRLLVIIFCLSILFLAQSLYLISQMRALKREKTKSRRI